MKKIFVACIALVGVFMVVNGIFQFLPLHFISNNGHNMTYTIGYNIGYFIGKLLRIALGVTIISLCYGWFCDIEINKES